MDMEWSIDEWNNWWKNPGSRPEGDEIENEGGEEAEGEECDYTPTVSEMLIKHKGLLFSEGDCSRVFVTFCGKALELKWLAEQGQEVVGNDCSDFALESFLKEQNIEFDVTESEKFKVFKGKEEKISLYAGNFFEFSSDTAGGKFDVIWDSASFQSVGINDRERYINTVVSLMKPTTKYLLSITDFGEHRTWKGPPYLITDDIIEETYGKYMKWKVIDHNKWGPYMERIVYLELKE